MNQSAHQGHQMTDSHILLQEYTYLEPRTIAEATALLAELGDRAHVLAGGTYLVIQMKMEQKRPDYVVNISKIADLDTISVAEKGATIGAMARIYELSMDDAIVRDYTALAQACAAFGSTQIQMMGTLGGNVANGSPASDAVPALLVFDAEVVIHGPGSERVAPIASFLLGVGRVALAPGELISAIRIPKPKPGSGSSFIKISRVAADLAKASVAAVIERDGDRIVDCRLAFGSVGPVVMRTPKAEASLRGRLFTSEIALEAGTLAAEEVSPIDDVRSTAWYRREVVKALTHDALQMAWERAGGDGTTERSEPIRVAQAVVHGGIDKDGASRRLEPSQVGTVTIIVNGERRRLHVGPNELLINVLRERLELTGAKYGCGIGECGACTVLIDGRPALACLQLAIATDGCEVRTVEGLADPAGELDPLQDAFIEHNAFQCGYCTPGMLMMTKALLLANASPSEDDVRHHLRGNRCRCTGFASIVRAVESVSAPKAQARSG